MTPVPPSALRSTYRRLLSYVRPLSRARSRSACWAAIVYAATMTSFALLAKRFGDGTFTPPRSAHHRLGAGRAGGAVHRCAASATSPRPTSWVTSAGASSSGCAARCFAASSSCRSATSTATPPATLLSRLTYNTEQIGQATTDSVVIMVRTALTIVGLDRVAAVVQLAAGADRAHHGAAGRLAGVGHQPLLPPLQPPHPGLDGRCHARRQGELRGAAADQGLQRAAAPRGRSSTRSTSTTCAPTCG